MICLAIGIWVFALDLKKIFQIENFMTSVIQIQRIFWGVGAEVRREYLDSSHVSYVLSALLIMVSSKS